MNKCNGYAHEPGFSMSYMHFARSRVMKLVGDWEQEKYEAAKRTSGYR